MRRGPFRWQKILIDTTKGREAVRIWGLNGLQSIVVDSAAGKENITLTDKAGQVIRMDAAQGTIRAVDKAGQVIRMDGAAGTIRATDKAGSVILMNGQAGNIVIQSAMKVLINP